MGNLSDTETLFAILGLLSVVLFFASVFILPLIIIYLPEDYFHRTAQVRLPMTPLRMIGKILKNLIGFVLLVAGFLMLFLPGQGILCGLLGISLLDFPKKRELQMKLLQTRGVRRTVIWIRRKAGRKPLQL